MTLYRTSLQLLTAVYVVSPCHPTTPLTVPLVPAVCAVLQTNAMKAGLKKVMTEWQPTTIVMEHGDVITTGAHEKLGAQFGATQ